MPYIKKKPETIIEDGHCICCGEYFVYESFYCSDNVKICQNCAEYFSHNGVRGGLATYTRKEIDGYCDICDEPDYKIYQTRCSKVVSPNIGREIDKKTIGNLSICFNCFMNGTRLCVYCGDVFQNEKYAGIEHRYYKPDTFCSKPRCNSFSEFYLKTKGVKGVMKAREGIRNIFDNIRTRHDVEIIHFHQIPLLTQILYHYAAKH